MAGLEILKKNKVDFNILTVIQKDNSAYPEEVYDFLKKEGSGFIQFIPIVEPEIKNGRISASDKSVSPLQWGTFLTAVFQRWLQEDIGKIFVQHFDLTLAQYMGEPASLCVHSRYCGKALAMEHNGNLYSCDHFVTNKNYLGHISEPLEDIVSCEKQVRFGKDKLDALPRECMDCRFLELCYGGCPKDRLVQKTGGRQNWLCEGYKYYYEKTYPVFIAMAQALRRQEYASGYRTYLTFPPELLKNINRNDPCPCLSGKKYKNCHGK